MSMAYQASSGMGCSCDCPRGPPCFQLDHLQIKQQAANCFCTHEFIYLVGANMKKDQALVWHYTTGDLHTLIMESGLLLPSTGNLMPFELPILWFSEHPFYEPTATKECLQDGEWRNMSVEEMYSIAGGLYRFGFPKANLLRGNALRAAARMPLMIWKMLEKLALLEGACPWHWWGTTQCLPVDVLVVERMNEFMQWERIRNAQSLNEPDGNNLNASGSMFANGIVQLCSGANTHQHMSVGKEPQPRQERAGGFK